MKETFLFCSIEGFSFPRFLKHNKLKFSSALEFLRRFDTDCLDSGPLFILHSFFYKNVVFQGQAEYSYFSTDFRL